MFVGRNRRPMVIRSIKPEPENPYFPSNYTEEENGALWDEDRIRICKEKPNKLKRFHWEIDQGYEGEAHQPKEEKFFDHEDLPYYQWEKTMRGESETTDTSVFDEEMFRRDFKKKIELKRKE
jgi:hypothetical protein